MGENDVCNDCHPSILEQNLLFCVAAIWQFATIFFFYNNYIAFMFYLPINHRLEFAEKD
jgi:hypothetical protein